MAPKPRRIARCRRRFIARRHTVGHCLHARAAVFKQLRAIGVVLVDDRVTQCRAVEQLALGVAVGLHAAVVIQMVTAEVGEHGTVELDAFDAPLIEGMGGHFHDNLARA